MITIPSSMRQEKGHVIVSTLRIDIRSASDGGDARTLHPFSRSVNIFDDYSFAFSTAIDYVFRLCCNPTSDVDVTSFSLPSGTITDK
jgi:hypothetical protein